MNEPDKCELEDGEFTKNGESVNSENVPTAAKEHVFECQHCGYKATGLNTYSPQEIKEELENKQLPTCCDYPNYKHKGSEKLARVKNIEQLIQDKKEKADDRVNDLIERSPDSFEKGKIEKKARIYEAKGAVSLLEELLEEVQQVE